VAIRASRRNRRVHDFVRRQASWAFASRKPLDRSGAGSSQARATAMSIHRQHCWLEDSFRRTLRAHQRVRALIVKRQFSRVDLPVRRINVARGLQLKAGSRKSNDGVGGSEGRDRTDSRGHPSRSRARVKRVALAESAAPRSPSARTCVRSRQRPRCKNPKRCDLFRTVGVRLQKPILGLAAIAGGNPVGDLRTCGAIIRVSESSPATVGCCCGGMSDCVRPCIYSSGRAEARLGLNGPQFIEQ